VRRDDRRLDSDKSLARVANTFTQPSETTTFLLDCHLTCLTFPPRQPMDMGDYVVTVSSPLETLARQTSSRRRPNPVQLPLSQAGSDEDTQYAHVPVLDAPPKRPLVPAPHSPLLHTQFRTSVATQSSLNTSNELYGPTMASGSEDFPYDDDVSIYSTGTSSGPTSGRLSNSVRAPAQLEQIPELSSAVQNRSTPSPQPRGGASGVKDGQRPKNGSLDPNNMYQEPRSNISVPLPIVVISSEEPEGVVDEPGQGFGNVLSSPIAESQSVGHRPSGGNQRNYLNFSRPMRAGGASEDTKREVLARNAFRRSPTSPQSPQPSAGLGASPPLSRQISPTNEGQHVPENPLNSSMTSNSLIPTRPAPKPPVAVGTQVIPLLHEPPRVSSSPTSLYSKFSYYELDSPSGSPTSDSLQVPASPHTPPQRAASPLTPSRENDQQPELADQLLQEGIRHHEANRLREAAIAFERSARTPGGSGVGMLMWGLTLRHGWGCDKDETLGFSWLRRAAEAAVGDLERARAGLDMSAVRGELVLAIYEVGQCFFRGWGVKKDQKMAVVSGLCYSYMCLWCSSQNNALTVPAIFVSFSPISKLRRGWAISTRKRNLRFAMPMAVVAKRTVRRRLSGTAQL
jgi:hypothetical protein